MPRGKRWGVKNKHRTSFVRTCPRSLLGKIQMQQLLSNGLRRKNLSRIVLWPQAKNEVEVHDLFLRRIPGIPATAKKSSHRRAKELKDQSEQKSEETGWTGFTGLKPGAAGPLTLIRRNPVPPVYPV